VRPGEPSREVVPRNPETSEMSARDREHEGDDSSASDEKDFASSERKKALCREAYRLHWKGVRGEESLSEKKRFPDEEDLQKKKTGRDISDTLLKKKERKSAGLKAGEKNRLDQGGEGILFLERKVRLNPPVQGPGAVQG